MRCSLDRQTNAYRWFPRRQKHTCKPSRRPNSVLMISSHRMSRCRSLGIKNDKDDVDRPFLSGDLGRLDRDQGCFAAGFRVRRGCAASKQDLDGTCPGRSDEVRPVGVARHPRRYRDRRDRNGAASSAGAGGPTEQAADDQDTQAALARCQRQDRSVSTVASASSGQRAKKERGQ
jgi:hypothetical protein